MKIVICFLCLASVSFGETIRVVRNTFGGYNIYRNGTLVQKTRMNVFKGQDFHSANGTLQGRTINQTFYGGDSSISKGPVYGPVKGK